MVMPVIAVYLGGVVLLSLISFMTYGWDKRRAVRGGRRVPERTLHLLAFFGGWPGAWLGQRQFRHKTQKLEFRIVFWMMVLLHCGIVSGAVIALSRPPAGPSEEWSIKITPINSID